MRKRAVITVFMTLLSVLFLSLAGALVDSARMRGARAQAAAIVEMGNFSLFGEFENRLLEEYEVFGLDGSRGSGEFSIGGVEEELRKWVVSNASQNTESISVFGFDPWKLQPGSQKIEGYTLLTDNGGEPYYRQVVDFMEQTALAQGTGALLDFLEEAENAEEGGKSYEEAEKASDKEMEAAEKAAAEAAAEQAEAAENAPEPKEDPLEKIDWLHRADPVYLLTGRYGVPEGSVSRSMLCFHRYRNNGNMPLPGKSRGLLGKLEGDLLFKEYLLAHFPCYTDQKTSLPLSCQLEYILQGTASDTSNLRRVILKLLLLREGINYGYLVSSPEKNAAASLLAAAILTVFDTVPGLHAALKHGLLLGWAFGESLLDVKTLLDGGSVPLEKTDSTFLLDLESLGDLASLLSGDLGSRKEGVDYKEHLRLLLYLQPVSGQIRRALEMTELDLRAGGSDGFRADNCITAVRTQTSWTVPPLFMRIGSVFSGTGNVSLELEAGGVFKY